MKRNLLAVAIPALLAAGAANASIEVFNKDGNTVSVNGNVTAKQYLTALAKKDDGSKVVANGGDQGDASSGRLGFNATSTISNELKVFARHEIQVNSNNKDGEFKHRYSYLGLDFGTYGKVSYGKNDGVLSNVTGFTDVLPEFSGAAPVILNARSNGVVTYTNSGFYGLVDGLDVAVQYQANTLKDNNNARAFGLSATYAILDTGVKVGAAYAQEIGPQSGKSINYALAASYEGYGAYAGILFSHNIGDKVKGADDKNRRSHNLGLEVVAKYTEKFDFGAITPSIAYVQNFEKAAEKDAKTVSHKAKYIELGVEYAFNENVSTFVDYKINLLSKTKVPTDHKNTAALGFTYKF